MTDADLVVIGCGPVGAVMAGLAAKRGLSVIVVDRFDEVFPLPRAVQCDHEVLRILQELGCADEILADSISNDGLDFISESGEVLLSFSVPKVASSGWPTSVFFHQPTFESTLRRAAVAAGAELRLGAAMASIEQSSTGATTTLENGAILRSRWVIGCDGARSETRRIIGSDVVSSGFEESWLVVDLWVRRPVEGLPTRCVQVCDPNRPHTLVPMPRSRFRFEFMLLPGETPEQLQDPAMIASLIAPTIDPDAIEIERAAVYTFRGLVASTWRDRRIFLAGDSAHQMPPFLGQGMCTGIRDAANLAWKLRAVADGAPDELLDTYEPERRAHAQTVIDAAVEFGKMICLIDPAAAADRDEMMRSLETDAGDAPSLLPALLPGLAVDASGGDYSTQPKLGDVRLDDVMGTGFALCTLRPMDPGTKIAAWWSERAMVLDVETHPELRDVIGTQPACLIRPDRYLLARGDLDSVTAAMATTLGQTAPNSENSTEATKLTQLVQ